eukprot:TRINITY_DN31112_c0_g1_i1.p1 TRINITY_DN31112_c0_g1~~TRINITY_DN31112_c0_g1_i1.p1  ORF type:complete len:581 (-),score=91.07 TRINITY_DN31112_c0_g1_i1:38-1744(-)
MVLSKMIGFLRDWMTLVFRHLGSSDYLAGMVAIGMMGLTKDGLTRLWRLLIQWTKRTLLTTVRLEEKDAELILAWLREREEVHSSSQLALYTHRTSETYGHTYEYQPEVQITTRLRARTKDGRGQWLWIARRDRSEGKGEPKLTEVLVSFFGRDKQLLEHLLELGREIQRRKRAKYLSIVQLYDYGKEFGLGWLHPQDKDRKQPGRSIASVVLPICPRSGIDQAEALLEDAREFLASELWYTERGIPYRRGYLLHGVPGAGKSSLVTAIASELRLSIYMLQLSSKHMSDETLTSLLQHGMHDPPTILLLEDVDLLHSVVLDRRTQGDKDKKESADERSDSRSDKDDKENRRGGRLTLSGVLNALDGPTATTGRLLFMTTNTKDRLDPALVRSGRIDYEVQFTYAEPEQVQRLFTRFYLNFRTAGSTGTRSTSSSSKTRVGGDGMSERIREPPVEILGNPETSSKNTEELAADFARQIEAAKVRLTSADVQRHLMNYKSDPEQAVLELPSLVRSLTKSQDVEKKHETTTKDSLGGAPADEKAGGEKEVVKAESLDHDEGTAEKSTDTVS